MFPFDRWAPGQASLALGPPAADPLVGRCSRDARFGGHMSDRAARADAFDQQPPALNGQPGTTVGHEDLRAWCGAWTPPPHRRSSPYRRVPTTLVINTARACGRGPFASACPDNDPGQTAIRRPVTANGSMRTHRSRRPPAHGALWAWSATRSRSPRSVTRCACPRTRTLHP